MRGRRPAVAHQHHERTLARPAVGGAHRDGQGGVDAGGKGSAPARRKVGEAGARDLDAAGRAQQHLGALAAEHHQRHPVAPLVGVDEQAEHGALHRLHPAGRAHRPGGVDREHEQVPGPLLASRLAQILGTNCWALRVQGPTLGNGAGGSGDGDRADRPVRHPVADQAAAAAIAW